MTSDPKKPAQRQGASRLRDAPPAVCHGWSRWRPMEWAPYLAPIFIVCCPAAWPGVGPEERPAVGRRCRAAQRMGGATAPPYPNSFLSLLAPRPPRGSARRILLGLLLVPLLVRSFIFLSSIFLSYASPRKNSAMEAIEATEDFLPSPAGPILPPGMRDIESRHGSPATSAPPHGTDLTPPPGATNDENDGRRTIRKHLASVLSVRSVALSGQLNLQSPIFNLQFTFPEWRFPFSLSHWPPTSSTWTCRRPTTNSRLSS